MIPRVEPEFRFWTRVLPVDSGCWEWQGRCSPYGHFARGGRHSTVGAHQFAYERFVGSIPKGLSVLHRCDNPPCVRPEHLFLGTNQDNTADMVAKGRARGACGARSANARKTHCPKGHEYSAANTIVNRGSRRCRICANALNRASKARRLAIGVFIVPTKTHCKHGHEYTPENSVWSQGARICRACRAQALRNLRARRREARS
jgi:hypothetical protein